jgi:hypothetical protein
MFSSHRPVSYQNPLKGSVQTTGDSHAVKSRVAIQTLILYNPSVEFLPHG